MTVFAQSNGSVHAQQAAQGATPTRNPQGAQTDLFSQQTGVQNNESLSQSELSSSSAISLPQGTPAMPVPAATQEEVNSGSYWVAAGLVLLLLVTVLYVMSRARKTDQNPVLEEEPQPEVVTKTDNIKMPKPKKGSKKKKKARVNKQNRGKKK